MTQATAYKRVTTTIILVVFSLFSVAGNLGFAADKYSILSFSVNGASCAACIMEIDRLLHSTKGIKAVNIDQTKRPLTVFVVFDKAIVQPSSIAKLLQSHKYELFGSKTLPYNQTNMAKFQSPIDKIKANEEVPNLILP